MVPGKPVEPHAELFLKKKGYRVVERNYRCRGGEVDLIALDRRVVVFIEVKARSGTGCGHPLEAITWKKRREIMQVASAWIDRHGHSALTYRFDAIAIVWRGEHYTIEHTTNAWHY